MRRLVAILSAIYVLFSAPAAVAAKRVALVVGNGAYRNVAQLPNPPIDAKAMATLLRNVGFEVVEGIDLNRDQMTGRLLEFGSKAQDADIALFYYAGHGMAVSGSNYLLPIDANIRSEMDVKLGAAINVDLALEQTMSDAKVKLVFLDACRDNPFAAKIRSNSGSRSVSVQTGLAEMKSGEGTLIAFATGPGQTALDGQSGTDSPFTRALLANIATPGVEIQQAMTRVRAQVNEETNKGQLPWGHTNLIGEVYLNPAKAPANTQAVAASTSSLDNAAEFEFWRSIRESRKPEEFNAYLTRYPNGQFKSLALARIASLQGGASTASRHVGDDADPSLYTDEPGQGTEDQIGLDRGQRRDVQRRLTGLGFDTRVNGKFDDSTRATIKHWQAGRGYPATGFLNARQYKALLAEMVGATQTSSNDNSDDKPARRRGGGGGQSGPGSMIGGMMGGTFRSDNPSGKPNRRHREDSESGQQNSTPSPEPPLPDFPWPPPAPSTYYVLPDSLLRDHPTVGEATDAIISALERTGYVERTFFRTRPGGVAVVTRLERIEPDGTHAEPDRWFASEKQLSSAAGLVKFLQGLFFVEKGRYRLIVFILQDTAFIPSSEKLTETEARGLIARGANILPADTRKKLFNGSYCTVLIYEFASDGSTVSLVRQSPLTAREHLEKAGVLSLLGKPN